MADLDLSEYNGASLVATSVTFLALSWISVLLRIYVRAFMTKCFQLDDWFMVVGQIVFTLSCSFILLGIGRGIGRHNAALNQDDEIDSLMWQALATATYVIDMMFIKLSIGIFLLRLAIQKTYRYILWASLVIVAIWSVVLFFWNMFQCKPVEAQWDYTLEDSSCVPIQEVVAAAYSLSVMCILSDWLYALIPIPMLWNVEMTKQTKITVIIILGLGIFASVATLIRLRFLADLEETEDILFAGTDAMVWTLVEPGVAIVAASLATIRPLLRAWSIRGFDSTGRTGKSGGVRSRTNRSTYNGTLGLDYPERSAAVELGPIGTGKADELSRANFSRPWRPSASQSERGAGPGYTVSGSCVVDGRTLRGSYENDDASSSISSFDVGREAHSQGSGRVGLGPGGR
ncbi:hypothetical protein VUR80DRAFT_4537 [Thermomyces stellatus]